MPGRARDQRGAAAVEFALVLPVLLTLMFGIISAGLAYSQAVGLTNAVREGARFGGTTAISPTNNYATWARDTIRRTQDTQFDDFAFETTICVDLRPLGTATGGGNAVCMKGDTVVTPALASSPPGLGSITSPSGCVARVWASRPFSISVLVPVWSGDMVRSAVEKYERGTSC